MNLDFFKMATQPPMMSTPKKGKYSSLIQEIARLPYRLFRRCSWENSESPKTPKSGPPDHSDVNMSPCRHSLRLLSNGYYICDEDSFCWDDLGNISFSPTQCTVSYKENMVRIFRRRRRPLAQRRLDLTSHGYLEDQQPPNYEDLNEQIHYSSSENLSLCDPGNTNLNVPTPHEIAESDTDYVSSGYSQHPNNGSSDPMSPIERFSYLEGEDKSDHQQSYHSCSGYLFVNDDATICRHSDDISSWKPTERQLVKKQSSDSITTSPTPSIESVAVDVDDTRQRRISLSRVFIPLFLLCLVFWWVRSDDQNGLL